MFSKAASLYAFVLDACADGQQPKCLTVVDKYTRECLSMEWFRSRAEAKVVIEQWRHHSEVRPHSSLGNMTPEAYRLLGTMNLEATLKN